MRAAAVLLLRLVKGRKPKMKANAVVTVMPQAAADGARPLLVCFGDGQPQIQHVSTKSSTQLKFSYLRKNTAEGRKQSRKRAIVAQVYIYISMTYF